MALTDDQAAQFSELEQQDLAEYRPVNSCALIALAVGILSSLALIHLVLAIIPLMGIGLAVQSFRQLAAADNKQTGRRLATIGLGLSVFFGSWALARETSREMRLYQQAREFAEHWLGLIRDGQFYELHQLMLSEDARVAAGISLEKHYANPDESEEGHDHAHHSKGSESGGMMEVMLRPHAELESLFHQPVLQRLRDLGSRARYEFRDNIHVVNLDAETVEVQLRFEVTDQSASGPGKSFPIVLTLVRNFKRNLAADWRVVRVTDPNVK